MTRKMLVFIAPVDIFVIAWTFCLLQLKIYIKCNYEIFTQNTQVIACNLCTIILELQPVGLQFAGQKLQKNKTIKMIIAN